MYMDYNMYNSYYGFNNYRNPNLNTNDEIISLTEAIDIIRQSINDEKEDELFYDLLINQAKTEQEKSIIADIRNDERKHNQILREVYYKFTGNILPPASNNNNNNNNNTNKNTYTQNLEKALFGELNAVKKYRKILGAMPEGDIYTLIMSIMTDELIHASKYNYLIHIASKD